MKKILVTGANGQLGNSIKERKNNLSDIDFIFTDINELNLLDEKQVKKIVSKEKPDVIINCAAYTAVDKAEEDQEAASKLNKNVPEMLGEISSKNSIKLIHVSTDYVFDGESNIPYTEKDKANPVTVYGKTKLDGENALLDKNPEALILRTSWLYSPYGKNFMKTMIKLGAERDKLIVVFDQIGSPTFSGHLADGIIHAVQKYFSDNVWNSGIYHFSNQGVCSWYDFAYEIMKKNEIICRINPVTSDKFPTAAKRPPYSVLNKSAFENDFEFKIPHWTVGLDNCLKEMK